MTERKTPARAGTPRPKRTLQWGRSDDGAEDAHVVRLSNELHQWLQWGRSDDGAEDVDIRQARQHLGRASMGPLR